MTNPFEIISERLNNIEMLLLDFKRSSLQSADTNQESDKEEQPISKKEVCRLLRCSEPTMTKWMASGKIPFYRKGRRVYFFKAEVLQSLEPPLRRA